MATFGWSAVTDTLGGISGYRLIVGTTPTGSNDIFNGLVGNVTNYTVSGVVPGQTLYARVVAVNNAGIEGTASAASAGIRRCSIPTATPTATGRTTRPRILRAPIRSDATSLFRIMSTARDADRAHRRRLPGAASRARNTRWMPATDLTTANNFTAVANGTVTATGTTASFTDTSTGTKNVLPREGSPVT